MTYRYSILFVIFLYILRQSCVQVALDARIVEALLFVNMGDDALNAKNVEALLFVNMGNIAHHAWNVEKKKT